MNSNDNKLISDTLKELYSLKGKITYNYLDSMIDEWESKIFIESLEDILIRFKNVNKLDNLIAINHFLESRDKYNEIINNITQTKEILQFENEVHSEWFIIVIDQLISLSGLMFVTVFNESNKKIL